MSSPEPRRPRAGIAFIDAVTGDPAAEAALERARDKLRVFARAAEPLRACRTIVAEAMAAMTAELGRIRRVADAESLRLVAEIVRGALDDANAQLSARGFDPPGGDLEAWEQLARIVERDPSNMTLAEIFDWAVAWSDREKLRARIAASAIAKTEGEEALLRRLRTQIAPAASPPAPPDAATEHVGQEGAGTQHEPPLTEKEVAVINTLARFDASRLPSVSMIVEEMDGRIRLSRRTIQPIVARLIELGLAERPRGERGGVRLTRAGRSLAPKIAD